MPRARYSVAAAILLFALAGCAAPTPQPTPATAEPTQAATPTPTPTPEPEVGQFVIGPAGFELRTSHDATLSSFRWSDEPAVVLEAVQDAFGDEPTVGFQAGDGTHYADFDTYSWDTLTLAFARLEDDDRDGYFLPAWVTATAEDAAGIRVVTRTGEVAGMPIADELDTAVQQEWYEGRTLYLIDPEHPELVDAENESTKMVGLLSNPEGTLVESIRAPSESRILF